MALDSDCFSKATVSTRSWMPAATSCDATIAVEPPTEPAVCTRNSGLPDRAEGVGEEQLGHHHALEEVGRLADDDGVDVLPGHLGVGQGPGGGLADEPGHRDVAPGGRVLGLADADDGDAVVAPSALPFQDADQVLLQARSARAVGHGPVGRAVDDALGGLAEAHEAGGHDRVGARAPRPTG